MSNPCKYVYVIKQFNGTGSKKAWQNWTEIRAETYLEVAKKWVAAQSNPKMYRIQKQYVICIKGQYYPVNANPLNIALPLKVKEPVSPFWFSNDGGNARVMLRTECLFEIKNASAGQELRARQVVDLINNEVAVESARSSMQNKADPKQSTLF